MTITSCATDQWAKRSARSWRTVVWVFLATVHLVAVINGYPYLSGPITLVLCSWIFLRLALRQSYLFALSALFFGFLASGFCLQLLGEVNRQVFNTTAATTLLLWSALALVERSTYNYSISRKHVVVFGTASICLSLIWIFSLQVDPRGLITFLGYGYDNAAHLTLGRMILEEGHSFLLSSNASIGPTFLQDAAQMGGTTFATIALLMGVRNSNVEGVLAIYAGITVLIPLVAVAAVCLGLSVPNKAHRTFLALVATAIPVLTGYLSRIWLSGYLNSNLGTLCLILLVVQISVQTRPNILFMAIGTCLMIHVYPLFAGFGVALFLPQVVLYVWSAVRTRNREFIWHRARYLMGVGTIFATLIVPLRATQRSYGGSQFLADGGIEPFPSHFFLMLGVLTAIILILISLRGKNHGPVASMLLIGCVCGVATAYSLSRVDKIAYYPTKLLIAGIIAVAVFVILQIPRIESQKTRSIAACLLFCLIIGYVFFQPREIIFAGPFMGDLPHSLREARHATPVIVEGGIVLDLAKESMTAGKAVLYLPKTQESELNTRWINALSGYWTDESWIAWMQTRSAISDNDIESAIRSGNVSLLMIATDDIDLGQRVAYASKSGVCFVLSDSVCSRRLTQS